jgi:hypothetical protein
MQNQEKEKTIQGQLQEKLDVLSKITPESLVRTGDLGKDLDFRDGVVHFKLTLNLFRDLKVVKLDGFPDQRLQNLLNLAAGAIVVFENIQKFQSTQPNPVEARNNLIQQVKDQYAEQHNQITLVLAYALAKGTDFDSLVGEAKIVVSKAKEEVKKAENASQQIDSILTAAKKAAPVIGVEKYAVIFKNEADSHRKIGHWWLGATIGLSILTIAFGIWVVSFYVDKVKEMNTAQSIQIGLAKLVILAVLYFGIVWSGRIYKAQQHNCVVNQHRHNALTTFETFVNATEDKETKNAVLIQTTKAIFSPQHSGFTAQEKELSTSPQILEIVRSVAGEGKQ